MTPEPVSNITDQCVQYKRTVEHFDLPRTLIGGTKAMRLAGKKYLPQEPAEEDEAYKSRLERTTLFNAFGKAVRSLTGKVFEKGIHEKDVPEDMEEWYEDIDMQGRDLERFIQDVTEDAMTIGMTHILVDVPVRPEGQISKADEKMLALRPYAVHVKAEDLFYWVARGGVLQEIRIAENIEEGAECKKRIRKITTKTWEIWEESKATNKFEMVSSGVQTLGRVPLITIYTRRTGFMECRPPLEDLAFTNVCHWQSSSDQRHILHVARVPLLFGTGFNNVEDVEIGPDRLIAGPTGSTLAYVEHSGAAITAGKEDLQKLEDQMAVLAMEPVLSDRTGNQTATARALDTAEAQSALKMITSYIEDSVNNMMKLFAEWSGKDPESAGSVEIECDTALGAQTDAGTQEVGKVWMAGGISRFAYLTELKRRGILAEDYDIEADLEVISEETAQLNQQNLDQQLTQTEEQTKLQQDLAYNDPNREFDTPPAGAA